MIGARLADLRALLQVMAAQRGILEGSSLRAAAGQLDPLAQRLAALCDRIEGSGAPPSAAERALAQSARELAQRAARDLSAILGGFHDAQSLLARRAEAETRVYGPDGAASTLAAPAQRLEQRR